jgi:P pilus assembly chaperone PapD
MKGVQSAFVFVLSHFAFCSYQVSQCFTYGKGASLVVVLVGVLMYSCNSHSGSVINRSSEYSAVADDNNINISNTNQKDYLVNSSIIDRDNYQQEIEIEEISHSLRVARK